MFSLHLTPAGLHELRFDETDEFYLSDAAAVLRLAFDATTATLAHEPPHDPEATHSQAMER